MLIMSRREGFVLAFMIYLTRSTSCGIDTFYPGIVSASSFCVSDFLADSQYLEIRRRQRAGVSIGCP